jgi:hypothetical protein
MSLMFAKVGVAFEFISLGSIVGCLSELSNNIPVMFVPAVAILKVSWVPCVSEDRGLLRDLPGRGAGCLTV